MTSLQTRSWKTYLTSKGSIFEFSTLESFWPNGAFFVGRQLYIRKNFKKINDKKDAKC